MKTLTKGYESNMCFGIKITLFSIKKISDL